MTTRGDLLRLFDAALAAVKPDDAVHRFLYREGNRLMLRGDPAREFDLSAFKRIFVIGAGKGTAPMARAVEEILGDDLTGGLIVVKYSHVLRLRMIECREAGHPVPDENGLRAGDELLALDARSDGFQLALALTREPPQRPQDFDRRVDADMVAELITRLPSPPRHVFVCGGNPFVEAAAQGALSAGIDRAIIRTERYGG